MEDNVLIYIIIFAILFYIILGVLTWDIYIYNQSYGCGYDPNVRCYNDWYCKTLCPVSQTYNSCFSQENALGPTGLADCLYGPSSAAATLCLTPPDGPPTGGTGLSCDCIPQMTSTSVQNCFRGCRINLEASPDSNSRTCCCNDPTNPNCAVNDAGIGIGPCAPQQ